MNKKTVGTLLKTIRLERRVSQKTLSKAIGLTESRISKLESDVSNNVGIRTIEKVLKGISTPPLEFYKRLYNR